MPTAEQIDWVERVLNVAFGKARSGSNDVTLPEPPTKRSQQGAALALAARGGAAFCAECAAR